eukprot:364349-Chlamydomonas_euryale.AAC.13
MSPPPPPLTRRSQQAAPHGPANPAPNGSPQSAAHLRSCACKAHQYDNDLFRRAWPHAFSHAVAPTQRGRASFHTNSGSAFASWAGSLGSSCSSATPEFSVRQWEGARKAGLQDVAWQLGLGRRDRMGHPPRCGIARDGMLADGAMVDGMKWADALDAPPRRCLLNRANAGLRAASLPGNRRAGCQRGLRSSPEAATQLHRSSKNAAYRLASLLGLGVLPRVICVWRRGVARRGVDLQLASTVYPDSDGGPVALWHSDAARDAGEQGLTTEVLRSGGCWCGGARCVKEGRGRKGGQRGGVLPLALLLGPFPLGLPGVDFPGSSIHFRTLPAFASSLAATSQVSELGRVDRLPKKMESWVAPKRCIPVCGKLGSESEQTHAAARLHDTRALAPKARARV